MAITENVLAGDLPSLVVFVGRDLTREDWVHGTEPAKRSSALGFPRRFDGAAAVTLANGSRPPRHFSAANYSSERTLAQASSRGCRREPHAGDWGVPTKG